MSTIFTMMQSIICGLIATAIIVSILVAIILAYYTGFLCYTLNERLESVESDRFFPEQDGDFLD